MEASWGQWGSSRRGGDQRQCWSRSARETTKALLRLESEMGHPRVGCKTPGWTNYSLGWMGVQHTARFVDLLSGGGHDASNNLVSTTARTTATRISGIQTPACKSGDTMNQPRADSSALRPIPQEVMFPENGLLVSSCSSGSTLPRPILTKPHPAAQTVRNGGPIIISLEMRHAEKSCEEAMADRYLTEQTLGRRDLMGCAWTFVRKRYASPGSPVAWGNVGISLTSAVRLLRRFLIDRHEGGL